VLQPGASGVGEEQGEVADDEVVVVRSTQLAGQAVVRVGLGIKTENRTPKPKKPEPKKPKPNKSDYFSVTNLQKPN
jgi:hypothetical protein